MGPQKEKGAALKQLAFVLALLLLSTAAGATTSAEDSAVGVSHPGTGARIAARLRDSGLPSEVVVMVIAMLPIVELRGAVPVGINLLGLPWYTTVLFAVLGNMLPVFLIPLFLEQAVRLLGRFRVFRRFFDWLFARTRRRSELIQRFEFWGLLLFVAVPLPATGAWTGCIAAVLMGLPYWRSVGAILCGVLVAGAVVTTLSLLGVWGAAIAGGALVLLLARVLVLGLRRPRPGAQ